MRWFPSLALPLVAAASVLGAPAAHASCAGPFVTATIEADGQLVIEGEGFGTDCHDTGPPPEGEGVLGAPARDISVVVRQDGVEFVVAQGEAAPDYTFHVEVEPPPMVGEALVEARYANQVGFTSALTPSVPVTLPESEDLSGGQNVVTFRGQSLAQPGATGSSETPVSAAPAADAPAEGSSDDLASGLPVPAIALVAGALLAALGTLWWNRRRHTGNR